MARFSVLTSLITLFYFFVWATQVSTPSHSDISLRIIEVSPQAYPILTISTALPIRSPCAGINRCDKSPIYKTWASKFVAPARQARSCLNAHDLVRPYLLQVGRYVHWIADMLGRPTPDSLIGLAEMPTTGKLAALLLGRAAVVVPPPLPTPPTCTLSVFVPPTPISGPWNPPTPTTGYSRFRFAEPVVETNSSDRPIDRSMSLRSTLTFMVSFFIWNFMVALFLVRGVEHRDKENDGNASCCDTIRPVVRAKIESSIAGAPQKTDIQQQKLFDPSLINETSSRTLDVGIWRSPSLVPNRCQLGLATFQLRLNYNLYHNILSLLVPTEQNISSTIERPFIITKERTEFSTSSKLPFTSMNTCTMSHRKILVVFHSLDFHIWAWSTEFPCRATPLVKRCPTQSDVARLWATASSPSALNTTHTLSHALVSPTLTIISFIPILPRLIPRSPSDTSLHEALLRTAVQYFCAPAGNVLRWGADIEERTPLLIEWYPRQRVDDVPSKVVSTTYSPDRAPIESCVSPPQDVHLSNDDVKVAKPDLSASKTESILPNPPPKPKVLLRIPPSFYRYANIRLEDLDRYPPEERDQILRREIKLAEDCYRLEKPRRDRARINFRLMRAEMKQKGERPLVRRKCQEQIEEEEEMKRVIRARQLAKEEVFKAVGGPPEPTPKWLLDWSDMLERECTKTKQNKLKGILKKGGEVNKKGKRVKVVRWMDELGRSLAR
ncbi:hypothetical protein RSOLAG22IIIB_02859 [Rhizoctonia solani]|uniref:Uncharacterized protein n=1 Tax=Rhizoctonia solani TaxID=456999 RepID=A0A0K6FL43_9AGAM|nr:hypothetical protein RSOLAG22IIIB_02859 [Rhizoctonia solani]